MLFGECIGISQGELDIIKRRHCKLLWLCEECKHELIRKNAQIEVLSKKVDAITEFMKDQLGTIIEETIKKTFNKENSNAKNDQLLRQQINKLGDTSDKRSDITGATERDEFPPLTPVSSKNEAAKETSTSSEQKSGMRGESSESSNSSTTVNSETFTEKKKEPRMRQNVFTHNVVRDVRPSYRPKVTIGIRKNEAELQAAEKKAWLYVGQLRESTTVDTVKEYLKKNGVEGDIDCEELNTKGNSKAFKLGIQFNFLEDVENSQFWPVNVRVRRFRFFRGQRQNEGISLT